MSGHVCIEINHLCYKLFSRIDNPKQMIYRSLAVESVKALIVDSVAVHKIQDRSLQDMSNIVLYFHDNNRIINLNFLSSEFGSNFVGRLDNGVLVLQNWYFFFGYSFYRCYDIFIE